KLSALQFEFGVKQFAGSLVSRQTSALQITQCADTGLIACLGRLQVCLGEIVLKLGNFARRGQLFDCTLEFQSLKRNLVAHILRLLTRVDGVGIRGLGSGTLRKVQEGKADNQAECDVLILKGVADKELLEVGESSADQAVLSSEVNSW